MDESTVSEHEKKEAIENKKSAADISSKAGALFFVVEWFDSWKKIAISIALMLMFCVSYFVYDQKDVIIFNIVEKWTTPRIDESKIDAAAVKLLADTGGKSIVIWTIDFDQNRRRAIYVRFRDDNNIQLVGTGDVIFRSKSDLTPYFINLIDYKSACGRLVQNTKISTEQAKMGMNFVCGAAVPPRYGRMIAVIEVAFDIAEGEELKDQEYVRGIIKEASRSIVK